MNYNLLSNLLSPEMPDNFSFEYPYVLGLLLLFILSSKYLKRRPQSFYIPHLQQALPQSNRRHLKSLLKWTTITFALIALSSPIITRGVKSLKEDSIDIVLSLDTSGSMSSIGLNENNYEQNRWDVVKDVVKEFINIRKKDRIGLVIFGDTSAIASPLSYDGQAQIGILQLIFIGVVGKSTALIDSIVNAISILKKSKNPSKVIILLSDGDDTASKVPLAIALELAKKHHIKIYTVSIGESNNNMLELIAEESNSQSFIAHDKEGLLEVYKSINKLERHQSEGTRVKVIEYLYTYFLSIALVSALFLSLISRKSEEI